MRLTQRHVRGSAKRKAAMPEVGLFWIDDSGTMFASSVSLKDAVDYGECRTFEGSHYELWSSAVCANPKWRGLEYEEIPRGRVVYFKDARQQQFVVYLPPKILKHRNMIIATFHLPRRRVRFDTGDEHYRCQK